MDPATYHILKNYMRNLLGGEDLQSTYAKKTEAITRQTLYNYPTKDEMNQEIRRLLGLEVMKGDTGESAYEAAIAAGFNGTESEWIASLRGEPGDSPYINNNGKWVINGEESNIAVNDYLSLANRPTIDNTPIEGDISNLFAVKANSTDVAETYLSKTDAASTYLTSANAASTYLSQANAMDTYPTKAQLAEAIGQCVASSDIENYVTTSTLNQRIASIDTSLGDRITVLENSQYDDTSLIARITALETALATLIPPSEEENNTEEPNPEETPE